MGLFLFAPPLHKVHHGSYARARQGHGAVCPPLPPLRPQLAEAYLRRRQGADLQAGQKGSDPVPDRRHSKGQPRCRPSAIRHRQQDPQDPEVQGPRPRHSGGYLLPYQEGGVHPEALERNRKDKDAKFRLILIESRIHRLARYYKTKGVLPPTWKYESSTASALVS